MKVSSYRMSVLKDISLSFMSHGNDARRLSLLHTVQVTMKGELYNIYTDTEGEQQTTLLGNVKDLRSIKVKEIGGIPIEKLQAHYEIQRNRAGKKDGGLPDRIVGFPDQTPLQLPPDTVKVYKVQSVFEGQTACGTCSVAARGAASLAPWAASKSNVCWQASDCARPDTAPHVWA